MAAKRRKRRKNINHVHVRLTFKPFCAFCAFLRLILVFKSVNYFCGYMKDALDTVEKFPKTAKGSANLSAIILTPS